MPTKTYLGKAVTSEITSAVSSVKAESVENGDLRDPQSVLQAENNSELPEDHLNGPDVMSELLDPMVSYMVPTKDEIEWVTTADGQTYPCQVCGRIFSDERMRNRHRRLHNVPGDKPFECKYCKKAFATHSNRKEHERIHTGERPYKCPVCDRRFIQISNLKKHIQTHKDLNTLK